MPTRRPTAADAAFWSDSYRQEREYIERRNHRRSVESRINEAALRADIALAARRRSLEENAK